MVSPLQPGLTPPEVAFLCEMELVTVVPRQRLEGLHLLGGPTPALQPPHRTSLPLWLALLLKRQRRANILPPPWLTLPSLTQILSFETSAAIFSPPPPFPPSSSSANGPPPSAPFLLSATDSAPSDALPYHWLELSGLLLEGAADDFPDADGVRRLVRDVRECRAAKMREGVNILDGGREVKLNGAGGLEVSENRAFICGVIDGLRKVGVSKEAVRREEEAGEGGSGISDEDDDEMDL